MARELVAIAPRTPAIREYTVPQLVGRNVRIHTEFASPKHGTEMGGYRGEPKARRRYDPTWGCVVPIEDEEAPTIFPHGVGNMAVGVVTEIGPNVTRFRVGDRVFGHMPIREIQTVDEGWVDLLPDGLTEEAAVCLDPVVMALPIRYIPIRLGDRVAIFGMGAIGLMAVQWAKLAGADLVIAVDPIAPRRALALTLGADVALDPTENGQDVGLEIRRLTQPYGDVTRPIERTRVTGGYWDTPQETGQSGVDVAIEATGNSLALHQAIRVTRYSGTIGVISSYSKDAAGLRLGDEFHVNGQSIVSVRAESLPLRDAPHWNLQRLVDISLRWMLDGRIRTEGIVTPIVPFEESTEAYRQIDEHPEESIKLGIRFPNRP